MFVLNDESIDNAIDMISGYIVFTVAERLGRPTAEVSEAFFASAAYALLCDKETGYYWDSMSELIDRFVGEIENGSKAD
jgi:hypothetical protein